MSEECTARIRDFAQQLYSAERDGSVTSPLTLADDALTVEDAYAIQMINIERKVNQGDKIVGHKIGLTSKPMQNMFGVSEPDFGHLLASMHYQSGEMVDFPLTQPKAEPELAFVLQEDLVGPDVGIQDVICATKYVLPAIEVIDSRIADWQIRLPDTIADNASSGCFVLSNNAGSIKNVNLATLGGVLKINGRVADTGAGAAVMGHPAYAVAWLARKLHSLGTCLKAGNIVLSGAVSAAVPIKSGDSVALSFGPLGITEFTLRG